MRLAPSEAHSTRQPPSPVTITRVSFAGQSQTDILFHVNAALGVHLSAQLHGPGFIDTHALIQTARRCMGPQVLYCYTDGDHCLNPFEEGC